MTVFNLAGRYVAYVDRCLHQGGPVCSRGTLHPFLTAEIEASGEVREYFAEGSRVIACPWHGWEYDLDDGRGAVEPLPQAAAREGRGRRWRGPRQLVR